MKPLHVIALAAAVSFGSIASSSALADRYHHFHGHERYRAHVGVFFGDPGFGWYGYRPYYYPYPSPYYYPPTVVVPPPVVAAPPVYIERPEAPAASSYWYYCPDTKAYYPYVRTCPSPWQRVAPHAPPHS